MQHASSGIGPIGPPELAHQGSPSPRGPKGAGKWGQPREEGGPLPGQDMGWVPSALGGLSLAQGAAGSRCSAAGRDWLSNGALGSCRVAAEVGGEPRLPVRGTEGKEGAWPVVGCAGIRDELP